MTETIIIGVLSLAGTLCGAYFANRKSTALIAYRLEQLEDKVNKHNNVIERTILLEKDAKDFHDELKEINHRIDDFISK